MSEENVEVVRRAFEAFDRGDLEALLALLAPETELHTAGRFTDTKPIYRGHQGWTDWWNTFRTAWEEITATVERVEELGDRVLVLGAFEGKGRASGVEVRGEAAWLPTVQDGLIVHMQTFATWKDALEAAGLSV